MDLKNEVMNISATSDVIFWFMNMYTYYLIYFIARILKLLKNDRL